MPSVIIKELSALSRATSKTTHMHNLIGIKDQDNKY
jgi:hypothetical protein